jgi:hypothetical protein
VDADRLDAVVTYHTDAFASGVVRFNEILAERLGVPLLHVLDPRLGSMERPLFSFKVSEVAPDRRGEIEATLDRHEWRLELFLHDWSDLPLERMLLGAAQRVWCGNAEIAERLRHAHPCVEPAWTPGLLLDRRPYQPAEISVFSFGMAHKIRTDMFRRLRDLLEASGQSYSVYVSSANHETKSMSDAESVFEEMSRIFTRGLYFMGNLSDVAVYNHLRQTTFFAAFFAKGARANNTSLAAAMEQGCVIITNLDEFSPPELVHMDTVIEIDQASALPTDPMVLKRLSLRAMEVARERSWTALVDRIGTAGSHMMPRPAGAEATPGEGSGG